MTNRTVFKHPIHWPSLFISASIGAGIALGVMILFLSGVDNPNPAWPKYWQVRPLIVMPLAGAAGGAFFYIMRSRGYTSGWQKIVAMFVSLLVYVIGLWLGSVVGLDGTLWN